MNWYGLDGFIEFIGFFENYFYNFNIMWRVYGLLDVIFLLVMIVKFDLFKDFECYDFF